MLCPCAVPARSAMQVIARSARIAWWSIRESFDGEMADGFSGERRAARVGPIPAGGRRRRPAPRSRPSGRAGLAAARACRGASRSRKRRRQAAPPREPDRRRASRAARCACIQEGRRRRRRRLRSGRSVRRRKCPSPFCYCPSHDASSQRHGSLFFGTSTRYRAGTSMTREPATKRVGRARDETPPHDLSFAEATRVWAKIGLLSFGGPAGQVALMHRELVERHKWIDEARFLHALNYCMLLPGPEATQLATYIGWLMHRTRGGLIAGTLFVLPGFVAILLLSLLYTGFRDLPAVAALFFGLKAAVLAVVIEAVLRIGRRALKTRFHHAVAALAFVAI